MFRRIIAAREKPFSHCTTIKRVKRNNPSGRNAGKKVLVDPPHDRHEAIVAVLAVDGGRQQVLDVAFIAAERVEQALQAERADAGMPAGDVGADLDLASNFGKALVEPRDGRGIMALGEAGLRD